VSVTPIAVLKRVSLVAIILSVLAGDAAAQFWQRPANRALIAACAADARRLCPGIRPGGGRILVCLNSQAESLSQDCFQALAERGLATAAALRLCRPDFERLCPGTAPGKGRALECLLAKREDVSPECSDALSAHGFDDGEGGLPDEGK
jgi:hypothetical protein